MPVPVVRHTTIAKSRNLVERTLNAFFDHRVKPCVNKFLSEFPKWDNEDQLLELRKKLRDEVKAALEGMDDRAQIAATTGEITQAGHEPMIALVAALIDFHIDQRLKDMVSRWG